MNSMVKDAYARIMQTGKLREGGVVGCSEEEIAQIEHHFGHRLPETYRSFLRLMGKKAGNCFVGTDMFFDKLRVLKEYASDLLAEGNSGLELKENDFVFSVHQGYQFLFFEANEDQPDPAICYYSEGMFSFEEKYSSFSTYLLSAIEDFSRILS